MCTLFCVYSDILYLQNTDHGEVSSCWNNCSCQRRLAMALYDRSHIAASLKFTAPPFSAYVYCGQTVAHLNYCWALVTYSTCIWCVRWGDPVWVLRRFSVIYKTIVSGLSRDVVCTILRLGVSVEHGLVTVRRTDGRTDGRRTHDDS